MAEGDNCCVKVVVYLLIFCNIVGGILILVGVGLDYQPSGDNNSQSSSPTRADIATGIISICLGLLLLLGAVKKHATCVLVYLVLMCIGSVIRTGLIFYVLVSFGSALGGFIAYYIVSIVILWALVYCVYLFYKSLVQERKMSNFNPVVTQFEKEDMA